MRFAIVLSIAVVLSACGETPTGPSSVPVPSTPGYTVPTPTPSPSVTVTPSSVTMAVGQFVDFTLSGGDVYNYTPVQPGYAFETNQVGTRQIRVRMFHWSDVSPVWLNIDTVEAGKTKTIVARIDVR